MPKFIYGVSPTSVILRVKLMDSSKTTGAGLTGLVYNSTGLNISTMKTADATTTSYTQAGSTIETISTLGTYAAPSATKCRFKEVDATNHPGVYEIQLADARFNATDSLICSISGVTNLAQCDIEVECRNLAANVIQVNGTAQTARDLGASVLISSGTGTGQLSVTSGVIASNVTQIDGSANGTHATGMIPADVRDALGNAITTTASGVLDVNVKNMNNVAATSITTINANIGQTQPLNFTGTGASALVKTDVTDIATAAVSTSTAQLGVNVVQMNAVSAASVTAINANQGTTQPVNFTGTSTSALVKSDMSDIAGAAVSTTVAQIGVNTVQHGGTVQTAGDIIPTIQSVGPIATVPTSGSSILVGGTPTNTYAACATLDGTCWIIPGTASVAQSVNLVFAAPAGSKANKIAINGYYNTGNPIGGKYVDIYAYNYTTSAYEMISNSVTRIPGQNGTTVAAYSYPLNDVHISAGGAAQIKLIGNTIGAGVSIGLDYTPYYYLSTGNSLSDIAKAVWQFSIPTADVNNSAAEYLRYIYGDFHGYVNSASDASHINITGLPAVSNIFQNYRIFFHLETANVFEGAFINSNDASGNVVLDHALSYTPANGDGVRIYATVIRAAQMDLINAPNSTSLTAIGTAVWASATRTLSSFGTLVADTATAIWGAATRTLSAFGFTVATNSDSNVTAIKSKTDQLAFTIANQVDANSLSGAGSNITSINGSSSAAAKLALSSATMATGTIDSSLFSPTTNQFDTSIITSITDHWTDRWLVFTSGSLTGEARPITGYQLSSGKGRFSTNAFAIAPSNADAFIIV